MAWQPLHFHAARFLARSAPPAFCIALCIHHQLPATEPSLLSVSCTTRSLCSLFKRQWFGGSTRLGSGLSTPDLPPFWGLLRGEGCAARSAARTPPPRREAQRPETTAQLGPVGGAHRPRGGSPRPPARSAHTRRRGRGGAQEASVSPARGRDGPRPPRRLRPLQGGGAGQTRGGREVRAPRTSARPGLRGLGGERRGGDGRGGATHSGCAAPRARALSQVPRSLTQCRRLRRARRPGRRSSPGARGGRWPDKEREERAREPETARDPGSRKRACAPPPAAGRRSRGSSGSSCRSRCSWETRQRGRACSGRTGSLPSPSLSRSPPPAHFRSSRPGRRSSSGGSRRRRQDYAPDGPTSRGSGAGRSPAAARTHFAVAAGREGPAMGNGTRIAPSSFSLPPPLRSAARPLGFRPLPLPQSPGWSCRRLAAAWLRGMVLSGGQSPAPGAAAAAPRAPLPSLPRTAFPRDPGPPPAFARGRAGGIRRLCCHRLRRNRLRARCPPPLRLPGARAGGGTWAPARERRRCALTCRRCRGGAGCGGGPAGRPGRALPAAAASRCCCCCRRGRCLRRRRRGFSCPVTLRSHDRASGATSAEAASGSRRGAGGERSGGKSPSAPLRRLPSPSPASASASCCSAAAACSARSAAAPTRAPRSASAELLQAMCSRGEELLSAHRGPRPESRAPCLRAGFR